MRGRGLLLARAGRHRLVGRREIGPVHRLMRDAARRIDLLGPEQLQPQKFVPGQRDYVRRRPDRRKRAAAEHLDRHAASPFAEIELRGLRRLAQIGDAEQDLVVEMRR